MRTVFDSLTVVRWLTDPLSAPFMQRALVTVVLLSIAGGLLGAWIVLRRLAFFTHAVGSATFPGLVVAGPWGIAPPLAALAAGLGFAGLLSRLTRGAGSSSDTATGLLLAGALARTWLATGFDPSGARALGVPAARGDWLLLALLAACVVAVLPAVGALLVSTLLVVPAATARLLTDSLGALLVTGVALAAAEGIAGLLLA